MSLSLDDAGGVARVVVGVSSSSPPAAVILQSTPMVVTPIGGSSGGGKNGPTAALIAARFNPLQPLPSHVLAHRYTSLDVYQLDWSRESSGGDMSTAGGGGGAGGTQSQQTNTNIGTITDTTIQLRMHTQTTQPLLGCIMQVALLPHTRSDGTIIDLVLVTSTSGFLSLLTFAPPTSITPVDTNQSNTSSSSSSTSTSPVPPRLLSLAHVRVSSGRRGGGGLSVGRRMIGAFLRVSSDGRALAIGSIEATKPPNDDVERTQPPEGGILIYPIGKDQTTSGSSASSSSAAGVPPATASLLPNLQSPIPIQLDGVITSMTFLPPHPSSRTNQVVRLIVGLNPFIRHSDGSIRHVEPSTTTKSNFESTPLGITKFAVDRPQLFIFEIDLFTKSITRKIFSIEFDHNDVIHELITIDHQRMKTLMTTSATGVSQSTHTTTDTIQQTVASASSSVRTHQQHHQHQHPCFVIIQLAERVVLVDLDSHSSLRFPFSLPLPPWISCDPSGADSLSSSSSSSSPVSGSPPPTITGWSWSDSRLLCATSAGEVVQLYIGRIPTTTTTTPMRATLPCMRFISLGFTSRASCILGLTAPRTTLRDTDEMMTDIFPSSHSMSAPSSSPSSSSCDSFLILGGSGCDGTTMRIEWNEIDQMIRTVNEQEEDQAQMENETHMEIESSIHHQMYLIPPSSALHRQSQSLPCLAPLHDFIQCNPLATTDTAGGSIDAGVSGPIFALTGVGRDGGALRVIRPNTIVGEVLTRIEDEDEIEPSKRKVFRGLIRLGLKRRIVDDPTCAAGDVDDGDDIDDESFCLLSSFLGSSRLSSLRQDGTLEDVSEEFTKFGFDMLRTTLDAHFTRKEDRIIQVTDREIRAIKVLGVGSDEFRGDGQPIVWKPDTTTMTSSSSTNFIIAHASNEYVLLSLSGSRTILLLRLVYDSYSSLECRFVVIGVATFTSDVSSIRICCVPTKMTTTTSTNMMRKDERLCIIVGTHDSHLHLFKTHTSASSAPAAPSLPLHSNGFESYPKLLHTHSFHLSDLIHSSPESGTSLMAESILTCSLVGTTLSSTPSSPVFHLFIGLRDGRMIRSLFEPFHIERSNVLRHVLLRRFGTIPLRLIQLDRYHILGMSNETHVIQCRLPPGHVDSELYRLNTKQFVWPWSSEYHHLSTHFQFGTSFRTQTSPSGIVCVTTNGFIFVDLDVSSTNSIDHDTLISEQSILTRLDATPRLIAWEKQSNLLCITTYDEEEEDGRHATTPTTNRVRSQLMIVDPISGEVIDRYIFTATIEDTQSSSSVPPTRVVSSPPVPQCLTIWSHHDGRQYIVVGTSSKKVTTRPTGTTAASAGGAAASANTNITGFETIHTTEGAIQLFLIERVAAGQRTTNAADTAGASSSGGDATAMDCSDSSAINPPPTSSSSSFRLRRVMLLIPKFSSSHEPILAVSPYSSTRLLFSLGGRMGLAGIANGALRQLVGTNGIGPPSIPIRHFDVLPGRTKNEPTYIANSSDKYGLSFQVQLIDENRARYPIRHADPYGRLARQAILFRTYSNLDDAANQSIHSSATPIDAKRIDIIHRGRSDNSHGAVETLKAIGFDAFGLIYLLRREPLLKSLSSTSHSPSVKSESGVPPSSSVGAAAATSASTSTLPPLDGLQSTLVQESSFLMPAPITRIRRTQTVGHDNTSQIVDWRQTNNPHTKEQESLDATSAPSSPAVSLPSPPSSSVSFLCSTRLGSFHLVHSVDPFDASWLYPLQSHLARSPLTRSLVANHHASFRGGNDDQPTETMIDGELLYGFMQLTIQQQMDMCRAIGGIIQGIELWKINARIQEILQPRQTP